MKNAYPEKPEIQYQKTSIAKVDVVAYINSLNVSIEVKRAAFVMLCNESSNFTRGINNNYGGVQADGGRWNAKWDERIMGTCLIAENKDGKPAGKARRFVVFTTWKDSVDFMIDRVQARGLYIGGITHLIVKMKVDNVNAFALAYWREWVTGDAKSFPSNNSVYNFTALYNRAKDLFKS